MLAKCTGCEYDTMKTEHGVGVLSEGAWVSSSGYFGFLYMFNGHVLFDHLNALLLNVCGVVVILMCLAVLQPDSHLGSFPAGTVGGQIWGRISFHVSTASCTQLY
jgi:hypothetical protein